MIKACVKKYKFLDDDEVNQIISLVKEKNYTLHEAYYEVILFPKYDWDDDSDIWEALEDDFLEQIAELMK